jgi:hypothetical protein
MERTCQAQLLAEAAGATQLIDDETANLTNKQIGNAFSGWFSSQPLFDKILIDEPDLLD